MSVNCSLLLGTGSEGGSFNCSVVKTKEEVVSVGSTGLSALEQVYEEGRHTVGTTVGGGNESILGSSRRQDGIDALKV